MQRGVNHEDRQETTNQPCSELQPLLGLVAGGGEEIGPAEQAGLAIHLAHCPRCSEALDREKELLALLAAHQIEPDAALLASCRASLEAALDRDEEWWWGGRPVGRAPPL